MRKGNFGQIFLLGSVVMSLFSSATALRGRTHRAGIFQNHADIGTVLHPEARSTTPHTALTRSRQRRKHLVHRRRLSVRVEAGFGRYSTDRGC